MMLDMKAVQVKSAWLSKINWVAVPTAIISFLAAIGLTPDDTLREVIMAAGSVGAPLVIWVLRTWFSNSVTKASVGK